MTEYQDFVMDATNGISDETLCTLGAMDIRMGEITTCEEQSRAERREHERICNERVDTYKRGYKAGIEDMSRVYRARDN